MTGALQPTQTEHCGAPSQMVVAEGIQSQYMSLEDGGEGEGEEGGDLLNQPCGAITTDS